MASAPSSTTTPPLPSSATFRSATSSSPKAPAASTTATFTVTRTGTAAFTVDYATVNGSATSTANSTSPADYTEDSGTLSFAAGEVSRTITVAIGPDAIDETEETFSIVLSNATGPGAVIVDDTGIATIFDDDAEPSLSIGDVTITEGTGGTSFAVFTVTLSAASGRPVSVEYATADGSAAAPGDYDVFTGIR